MCGNRLPFQNFPGIFSSIDAYSKSIMASYFLEYGRVPAWFDGFGELGDPIPVPGWSKFQTIDAETNIRLTGVPDAILRDTERGMWIADYKTARLTDAQDALGPMYEVQLNAYGLIAQRIGLGSVCGLLLVYYEPVTAVSDTSRRFLIKRDGFFLEFSPKLKRISFNPSLIAPLLRRVREICERSVGPEPRPDCPDCLLLDTIFKATPAPFKSLTEDLLRCLDARSSHQRPSNLKRASANISIKGTKS